MLVHLSLPYTIGIFPFLEDLSHSWGCKFLFCQPQAEQTWPSSFKRLKKISSTRYLYLSQLDALVRNHDGPGPGRDLSRTKAVYSLTSSSSVTLSHISHWTEMINFDPYTSISQPTFEIFSFFALSLEQIHRDLSPNLNISNTSSVLGMMFWSMLQNCSCADWPLTMQ